MKILAIDLGKARTGIAVSDEGELLASPVCVIQEYDRMRLADRVASVAKEHRAGLLVLGLPRNMDGSEGESARSARDFGGLLEEKTGLPVAFQDERGTTVTAHNYLNQTNTRGRKRKSVVDAVAAVIILQNHLDYRRNCQ